MPLKIEEQFVEASLKLLHDWQKAPYEKSLYLNKRIGQLFKIIEKSDSLRTNISLEDLRHTIRWVAQYLNKWLQSISDDEFIKYLKSTILATKTYHFYYPIYNLYNFPKKMKLGYSTILTFDDLPERVQQDFIVEWKHHFTVETEYAKTEEEFINRKKRSTFLNLIVMANGSNKAIEKASNLADESVHILRFLYRLHFPTNECRYIIKGSKISGAMEATGQPKKNLWFCHICQKI